MPKDIISKIEEAIDNGNIWSFYHEFCEKLPSSNIHYQKLLPTLSKLTSALGNDWAIGELHDSIRQYAINNTETIKLLFNSLIDAEEDILRRYAPNVFEAVIEAFGVNEAWDSLKEKVFIEGVKNEALESIYRTDFELFNKEDKNKEIDSLRPKLTEFSKSDNLELQSYALMLYVKFNDDIPEAKSNIISLAKIEHVRIQSSIKHVLSKEFLNDELFSILLLSLTVVNSEHTFFIKSIESKVLALFDTRPELAEKFLTQWIIQRADKNGSEINSLIHLFQELYRRHNSVFKRLFTKWLNHDNKAFHKVCKEISNEFFISRIYDLELDEQALSSFEFRDIRFITSKILGFLFARQHLRSLLYSILENRNDQLSQGLIVSSFTEYLMPNYPSTKDYLLRKKHNANEVVRKSIESIINTSDQYFKAIQNLPIREELRGSMSFTQEYNKFQGKLHSAKLNETKEGSISSLFKKISIKAGTSSFHRNESGYSDKSPFGEITVGDELPRAERIDQYAMSIARLHWTLEERK